MVENTILRSQKNEIFERIKKYGLNPSEFKWIQIDSKCGTIEKADKLFHQPTEHYSIFEFVTNKHWAEYSPGPNKSKNVRYIANSWDTQLSNVEDWLVNLKKELVPDLWEAFSKENILDESNFSSENDYPFTKIEQEQISKKLNEIEKYLKSIQNLSKDQEKFIRERFLYLEESSKHQNKRDWLYTAIGVFFTIVVGVGMAPQAANDLFYFISHTLSNIFDKLALP